MELFRRRRWRSYLPNCQTTLVIALDALSLLFCIFINTTSYHLGRYRPSPPSTKELHALIIEFQLRSATSIMPCARPSFKQNFSSWEWSHFRWTFFNSYSVLRQLAMQLLVWPKHCSNWPIMLGLLWYINIPTDSVIFRPLN